MDEVSVDMLSSLCFKYNEKYNKNLKVSDIKTYNLAQYIGNEGFEIINKPGFFMQLQAIGGAIETIKKLINNGLYEVFIVSSPMNEHSVFEKFLWVKEYLPFFNIRNLILVGNKGELLEKLDGNGILFDDCPDYVRRFRGITVVMDREYNKDIKCDFRVSNWDEFYKVVKEILK